MRPPVLVHGVAHIRACLSDTFWRDIGCYLWGFALAQRVWGAVVCARTESGNIPSRQFRILWHLFLSGRQPPPRICGDPAYGSCPRNSPGGYAGLVRAVRTLGGKLLLNPHQYTESVRDSLASPLQPTQRGHSGTHVCLTVRYARG